FLLLPQPTKTATHSKDSARDLMRIRLLLGMRPGCAQHMRDSLWFMQVRVRLFAVLRERAGSEEVELELPDGARVQDALEQMHWLTDGVRVVLAVNREYADAQATLNPGDEV